MPTSDIIDEWPRVNFQKALEVLREVFGLAGARAAGNSLYHGLGRQAEDVLAKTATKVFRRIPNIAMRRGCGKVTSRPLSQF